MYLDIAVDCVSILTIIFTSLPMISYVWGGDERIRVWLSNGLVQQMTTSF